MEANKNNGKIKIRFCVFANSKSAVLKTGSASSTYPMLISYSGWSLRYPSTNVSNSALEKVLYFRVRR
ncbi:hypothetical protein BUQ74_16970 [Leptospira weilii serovar Heyan]|nr:hypothetical protein BUQ74_16970 [Leptospira weilii serovar Heyan]